MLCRKKNILSMQKFLKAGTRDGDNGFLVRADCYNIAISELQGGKNMKPFMI